MPFERLCKKSIFKSNNRIFCVHGKWWASVHCWFRTHSPQPAAPVPANRKCLAHRELKFIIHRLITVDFNRRPLTLSSVAHRAASVVSRDLVLLVLPITRLPFRRPIIYRTASITNFFQRYKQFKFNTRPTDILAIQPAASSVCQPNREIVRQYSAHSSWNYFVWLIILLPQHLLFVDPIPTHTHTHTHDCIASHRNRSHTAGRTCECESVSLVG